MFRNYEAYDTIQNYTVYSGSSNSSLIDELIEYIKFQKHIDENLICEEVKENMN